MEPVGKEVDINWNGRRVRAFVPALLRDRDFTLDVATVIRTATATNEIAHAAESLLSEYEPLVRLLLRAEGIASSYIEGITAPVIDVVLSENLLGAHGSMNAQWVARNLHAVSDATDAAANNSPLTAETLCEWHRILMSEGPTPHRYVGVFRTEQGWIGGTSPLEAHPVTPPASAIAELLEDLVDFVNRVDLDPIAQAAVSHAQFEIIHPFSDGDGRVGRILVAWLLTRRLSLVVAPPVSVAIAADVAGYSSGLVLFRYSEHRQWISWFADAVANGAKAQRSLVAHVEQLKQRWRDQLTHTDRKIRSDAAVFAALDLLPRHLVLTSQALCDELGVSRKTALATLYRLVALGILTEQGTKARTSPGQPATVFVSGELLGLVGSTPLR